jgi:hypothetical protein
MQLLFRAIHTRFPCGSATEWLNLAAYINSPDRSTKSTTSHLNVFCVLVNIRFQVLFHSPPGVLFTFPSQYCSTIGHQVVFRLGGWSPHFPSDSTCPMVLRIPQTVSPCRLQDYHLLRSAFPHCSTTAQRAFARSIPRPHCCSRFGLFRFRSPLLTESRLISFPPGT